MAKKSRVSEMADTGVVIITSMKEAVTALEEMEELQAEIDEKMRRATSLKQGATDFAVKKNVDVIQLDGHYFRQINRSNRSWDATMLKKLVKGIKVDGKPIWNLITKRVPDPEAIDRHVKAKNLSAKKIAKAFTETPQKPFLQRFIGDASDG